jgi:hypothetical protein
LQSFSGYPKAFDVDYWTSSTTQDCKAKPVWCSSNKVVDPNEIIWKSGHPIENACVHLRLSEKHANNTIFASAACTEEKLFVCEVMLVNANALKIANRKEKILLQAYKNGTKTKQLVRECLDIWNVSTEDLNYVNSDAFSNLNVSQNIKVKVYNFYSKVI